MTYHEYYIEDMNEPLIHTKYFCDGMFEALRFVDRHFGIISFEGTPDRTIAICQKTKVSIDRVKE